ncbi:MAG TPA: hypothetical protein VKV24_11660 [Casimicrobiaceae bacterium]|nr:hypothetical protein [Casimicrobiaceae bacterium]
MARGPRTRRVAAFALVLVGLIASTASGYTQDKELEARLNRSDRAALALLPAKGYRDGAAGFFVAHDLHVVPGSERAWCTGQDHGVLPAGCYVELVFQGKGLRERDWDGEPCGCIARWRKAPGAHAYAPTPGSPYAQAIADDRGELVERAIYDMTSWTPCR